MRNMRIAACLSGHSRNYKDNFPNIPFEVDYFISSYVESGLPADRLRELVSYHFMGDIKTSNIDPNHLIYTYKPKSFKIESETQIPNDMLKYLQYKTHTGCYLKHIGMMFYNIYQANSLKKEYEYNNNFRYDFVIRSRFDILVNKFNFDTTKLYLISESNRVLDLFFAGPSYIIDAISDCYIWFIHQTPEFLIKFANAEEMFNYYIKQLKLNIPYLNTFDITFNKDAPIQTNRIRNGITLQYDLIRNVIINLDEWQQ